MGDYKDSIASEAHGLVYGARAKTYGHPRFDFTSIGKVWTGLLQDLLKDGAEIDAHRVAVLMTGLKLARLVKSPTHHDSRVDTIGYMLTMERLDEPENEQVRPAANTAEKKREFDAETQQVFEDSYYGDTKVEPSKNPATGDLQVYTFPFGSHAPFMQKAIYAHTFKEAKAKFEEWKACGGTGEDEGPSVQYPYYPVDNPLTADMGGANPSDADVKAAMDILARRQAHHDREARELLVKGDGIGLGP